MCKPDAGVGLAVAIKGVDALVLCTGTTAFPSDKWGKNKEYSPQKVDDLFVLCGRPCYLWLLRGSGTTAFPSEKWGKNKEYNVCVCVCVCV